MTHADLRGLGGPSPLGSRGLSRRRFLSLAGASGLAFLVGGCTGSESGAPSAGPSSAGEGGSGAAAKVLYDFTFAGAPGSVTQYWEELSTRFADSGRGSLELTETPYEDLQTRTQAAHTAKQGLDVVSTFPNLTFAGAIFSDLHEPLDDHVGGGAETDKWLFRSPGSIYNGKHYMAPMFPELNVLVANTDHLSAAGIDPGERFASWEAFVEALDKLKAQDVIPVAMAGADIFNAIRWSMAMGNQWLDSVTDVSKFGTGEVGIDDPKITSWIRQLAQLKNGYVNDDVADVTDQQITERFRGGEGAFAMMVGAQALDTVREGNHILLPLWEGPGQAAPHLAGAGLGFAFTSYGNPEVSGELVKFWNEPEQLSRLYELTGELPANSQFDIDSTDEATQSLWEIATAKEPYGWVDYVGPGAIDIISATQSKVLTGAADADQAVEEYGAEFDTWREQNEQNIGVVEEFITSVGQ